MLFEHMIDNFRQFVGGGCGGFRRPEFASHTAEKGPEIARAGPETLRRHPQGPTRAILDPSAARGEHFPATDLIVRTEAQPGGKMFISGPFMHIETHFGEDDVDRWGL